MTTIRSIQLSLIEEQRECCFCHKSLVDKDTMLYIVVPVMERCFELCSWYCLYKFVVRMLKDKLFDIAAAKNDILSKLGWTRKWGSAPDIAPITDPIEDPKVEEVYGIKGNTEGANQGTPNQA